MTQSNFNASITELCQFGLSVVEIEARAIQELHRRLDDSFAKACQLLLNCQGRIIVIGLGKSGHIGRKIAATFASTGSPAYFVHPSEAGHGDMGMITKNDVIIALSNSGNNHEILLLLPFFKRLQTPIIALTGKKTSPLGEAADVILDVSVSEEACPLGLAPTASTTVALVMGDALAMSLLQARGFTADDFALSHPGGQLGRRLLLRIEDLMHKGAELPIILNDTSFAETILEMSKKGFGSAIITDAQGILLGIFTDGDLRRAIEHSIDLKQTSIEQVMTKNCKTISPHAMAVEALNMMQQYKITGIVVTDADKRVVGLIHMHDLLRSGIV